MLVLVLAVGSLMVFAENLPTSANNLVIKEVSDESVIPLFYTPLTLNGLNHVVYGFNNSQGKTQFRVYGQLNGIDGFYPINLSAKEETTATGEKNYSFSVTVEANLQALNEDVNVAGVAKAAPQAPGTLPLGYQKWGNQNNVYYFTNAFGEKEYRIFASYGENANYDFYPALAQTGEAVPGALAVNTDDDRLYIAGSANQYADKPATMAQGWKRGVKVAIGEQTLKTYTDHPEFTTIETIMPTPQIITVTPAPTQKPTATKKPSTSGNAGGTVLSQGSKGESVLLLTRRLVILGYMNSSTRTYTQTVTNAVKNFQRAYGLVADGVAGGATLNTINTLVPSTSYLSLNHHGPKVTELTKKLIQLGYLTKESNVFNATVEQAVRNFQRNYGLAIDGIVGKNTEAKLNAAVGGVTPSDPYWALYSSRILRYGNSGEAVYQLSQRLIELGYLTYTSRTFEQTVYEAVLAFQRGQGLNVDGIVGQGTLKALKNPKNPTPPTAMPIPTGRPSDLPTGVTPTQPTPVPSPDPSPSLAPVPSEPGPDAPHGSGGGIILGGENSQNAEGAEKETPKEEGIPAEKPSDIK